jgi:hypothetical protein
LSARPRGDYRSQTPRQESSFSGRLDGQRIRAGGHSLCRARPVYLGVEIACRITFFSFLITTLTRRQRTQDVVRDVQFESCKPAGGGMGQHCRMDARYRLCLCEVTIDANSESRLGSGRTTCRPDIREEIMADSEDTRNSQDPDQGPVRSGEDRRKVNIPPPPGSPVRSGQDRRKTDQRSGVE